MGDMLEFSFRLTLRVGVGTFGGGRTLVDVDDSVSGCWLLLTTKPVNLPAIDDLNLMASMLVLLRASFGGLEFENEVREDVVPEFDFALVGELANEESKFKTCFVGEVANDF